MAPRAECVNVVVRCRPLNERELKGNETAIVRVDEAARQVHVGDGDGTQTLTFDSVFGSDSAQADVFAVAAQPIVDSALQGYNGTIFAYGQTGTGKTYTMDGGDGDARGVIPRAFEHIFESIRDLGFEQCLVQASFLEIYLEQFKDLLDTSTPSNKIRIMDSGDAVKVIGVSVHTVTSSAELAKLLHKGLANRKVGAQNMNAQSSRSHAVFTVTVECKGEVTGGHVRKGCLNLVDLAGSEKQKQAGAEGLRLEEANKINLSLSTLGQVITALVQGTKPPFRNSNLTHLLKDSLGGNTKTAIIANVSPAAGAIAETKGTLRYANQAKRIKNRPVVNLDPKDAKLGQLQDEMKELEAQLAGAGGGAAAAPVTLTEADFARLRDEIEQDLIANSTARGIKLSDEQHAQILAQAQAKAEAERAQVEQRAKEAVEEARRIREEAEKGAGSVEAKQAEAERIRLAKEGLQKRLDEIRGKIVQSERSGCASLVEEARRRESELQKRQQELEARRAERAKLEERLAQQEEAALMKEQEYDSLEQQKKGTKAKLMKLHKKFKAVTREVDEEYAYWHDERHDLQLHISTLRQRMALKELMLGLFVPEEERSKVFGAARWCEEERVWRIDAAAAAKKSARAAKRPVSASGMRRPTTDFTMSVNAAGNLNPRFRSENILSLELDMPERTTFDFDDLVGTGALQEALNMVYPEEQDINIVGAERGPKYLDVGPASPGAGGGEIKAVASPARPSSGRQRPVSARRTGKS